MSANEQLEEERRPREVVGQALYEAEAACGMCSVPPWELVASDAQESWRGSADAAIEASGLPLRNKQLEAVMAKCDDLAAAGEKQIEEGDSIWGAGLLRISQDIRRAIEEADHV